MRIELSIILQILLESLPVSSSGNLALVKATNEDELLHTIPSIIVEEGGYSLATVV